MSSLKIDWQPGQPSPRPNGDKVFIVHGHDETPKLVLSNFLYKLGLVPIILHEQPNKGRTIIEKFEQNAGSVRYAFVLLTSWVITEECELIITYSKFFGEKSIQTERRRKFIKLIHIKL